MLRMSDSDDDARGAVESMLDEMSYQTDLLGRVVAEMQRATRRGMWGYPRATREPGVQEALGRRAYATLASRGVGPLGPHCHLRSRCFFPYRVRPPERG